MNASRATKVLSALIAMVALGLVTAVPAEASRLTGGLERGKRSLLIFENGKFERASFYNWRAPCSRRGTYREKTSFVKPLDSLTKRSFRDQGSYKVRYPEGVTARVKTKVKGRRQPSGAWSGTFAAKVRIKDRSGRVFNRCRFAPAEWTVRRR